MAVLQILTHPDPRLRLRRPCLPVGAAGATARRLAADMPDMMYAAPGRGLAAPQVGALLRLFVMDVDWRAGTPAPRVCIAPEILDPSDATATCEEGCLSIPGVPVPVTRPAEVTLCWTGLDGIRRSERLTGIAATCAQHELDHLDGRLRIDLMGEAARAAAVPALAVLEAR